MENTETDELQLNDEVIGQIAKLVQLAILTGTDVVDNLRMMRVAVDNETGQLTLTDSYRSVAESQVKTLMDEASAFQPEEV
tara:strand:- start:1137 stop:1379 length:243 start_codon:yes stop_codon:yes gene_type:complete